MTRDEKLTEIALQIQQWLDFQERERESEGVQCTDDTHVRSFPLYPTRGQLKAWIEILKTPDALPYVPRGTKKKPATRTG